MAEIKDKNFSGSRVSNFNPQPGDIIQDCNLSQLYPHTGIAVGVTNLVFIHCNLTNCDLPADAIYDRSRVQVDRCGHLDDRYRADCSNDGGATLLANCTHSHSPEEIWIDGVLVETLYQYSHAEVI